MPQIPERCELIPTILQSPPSLHDELSLELEALTASMEFAVDYFEIDKWICDPDSTLQDNNCCSRDDLLKGTLGNTGRIGTDNETGQSAREDLPFSLEVGNERATIGSGNEPANSSEIPPRESQADSIDAISHQLKIHAIDDKSSKEALLDRKLPPEDDGGNEVDEQLNNYEQLRRHNVDHIAPIFKEAERDPTYRENGILIYTESSEEESEGDSSDECSEEESAQESVEQVASISEDEDSSKTAGCREHEAGRRGHDYFEERSTVKSQRRGGKFKTTNQHDNVISDEEDDDKGPIRSKHELKDLPPVRQVKVKLEPHHNTSPVGFISSVLNINLVVEGAEGQQVLNEGSILWLTELRLPLGIVDEIFGPVKKPFYVVRYNNTSEVPEAAKAGVHVSYVLDFASFVLNYPSLYKKGYDASGDNDEELSEAEVGFSDDEKEAEFNRSKAQKKRSDRENEIQENEEKRQDQGRCGIVGKGNKLDDSQTKGNLRKPFKDHYAAQQWMLPQASPEVGNPNRQWHTRELLKHPGTPGSMHHLKPLEGQHTYQQPMLSQLLLGFQSQHPGPIVQGLAVPMTNQLPQSFFNMDVTSGIHPYTQAPVYLSPVLGVPVWPSNNHPVDSHSPWRPFLQDSTAKKPIPVQCSAVASVTTYHGYPSPQRPAPTWGVPQLQMYVQPPLPAGPPPLPLGQPASQPPLPAGLPPLALRQPPFQQEPQPRVHYHDRLGFG